MKNVCLAEKKNEHYAVNLNGCLAEKKNECHAVNLNGCLVEKRNECLWRQVYFFLFSYLQLFSNGKFSE